MRLISYTGQSLIELLIVIGLLAILLPVLFYGFIAGQQGRNQEDQQFQAVSLLKEASEAVRNVKEADWNTFAIDGNYHADVSGNKWVLANGPSTFNGLGELINIADVYRNPTSQQIVTSGGTLDPSTKKVTVTVSWSTPRSSSISSTLYLTRLTNLAKTYTTTNDFSTGTLTNTYVVSTPNTLIPNDGEVDLGAGGGGGNWCQPSKSITQVDLPKQGVANAISAIEGSVFAGTGNNASGVSFAKVTMTTNQDPPIATISATFDGYKTNSVFGTNNYAFLTTNTNGSQVVIIYLNQYSDPPTNSKYLQAGSISLGSGSVTGQSIFVNNNFAYITASNNKFYIYDVSNPSSPVAKNGTGLTLAGVGEKVLVAGSYAYVATNSTEYPLEIINISNPTSPSIVGKLEIDTGQTGIDVYVNTSVSNPTRAYLVTNWVSGKKDFYIVDVSNPSSPTIHGLSSYDTGGMNPTGVTVVTGNRAIVVGTGGTYQYQVIDITNETGTLSACATLQYSTGVYGVSSVLQSNGYAYSYIITGDANAELKIILGGSGGQYTSAGTFESASFDPGYNTAFNRFTATVNTPPQTNIQLQIAIAAQVNGTCQGANYTYIGPDQTTNSYFTPASGIISGGIPYISVSPYYINPGRCFRYKAYLSSTDSTKTPALYDITINYSP